MAPTGVRVSGLPGAVQQDPSADLGLHDPHRIGVDGLRRDEPDTLLRVGLEHAADHDDMEVRVLIQRRTEPAAPA